MSSVLHCVFAQGAILRPNPEVAVQPLAAHLAWLGSIVQGMVACRGHTAPRILPLIWLHG